MLGSVEDALLRAWKALDRCEGRSSPKSWLYRIATNACLDALARRPPKRELPIDRGPDEAPLTETVWLEPTPTTRTPPTSSARASSWRSSRRCSTCRPTSARS